MGQANSAERRQGYRKAFLRRAQIVFAGGAVDCVVEDLSDAGARVRLGNPTPLPEAFALRFQNGTSHPARRRWMRGAVVGMEFDGAGSPENAERRHKVEAVREASKAADPAAVLGLLRSAWFFGDEDLRRAAADLEVAQFRFAAALAPHLRHPK
jgi:hypothetical protein